MGNNYMLKQTRLFNAIWLASSSPPSLTNLEYSRVIDFPFNFLAVLALVFVRCPLTGYPITCLLPMYVPICLWCRILALTTLFNSDSNVIWDNSKASLLSCGSVSSLRRHVLWIDILLQICSAVFRPMP